MKALVYRGPGKKALEERPMPDIQKPTDAVVKILDAYETFGKAAESKALKVIISAS